MPAPSHRLDRHIADRHPTFHGERLDRAPPELDDIALTTTSTNPSNDKDLQSNVQNSSISAYEAAVKERLLSRIMDGLFEGTIKGDTEKAEFYTELNKNSSALIQIRNAIIHKINDLLLAS